MKTMLFVHFLILILIIGGCSSQRIQTSQAAQKATPVAAPPVQSPEEVPQKIKQSEPIVNDQEDTDEVTGALAASSAQDIASLETFDDELDFSSLDSLDTDLAELEGMEI